MPDYLIISDHIAEGINMTLGLEGDKMLSLAQVLESATWKGGRKLARQRGGEPPISVVSDGTLF